MDDSKGSIAIESMINEIVESDNDDDIVKMKKSNLNNTQDIIKENGNIHDDEATESEELINGKNGLENKMDQTNLETGEESEQDKEKRIKLEKLEEKRLAKAEEKRIKAEEEALKKIESDILFKKYRIEIKGYPKNLSLKDFKNLCQVTLQIPCYRIKTCYMGRDVIYASFRTPEDLAKAMVILDDYKYKGGVFSVKKCDLDFDLEEFEKIDFLHIPYNDVQELSLEERISKAVIPNSEKTYETELATKEKNEKLRMDKFNSEILEEHPELAKALKYTKRTPRCKLDSIVPAPERSKYLNKCDFSIGYNNDSQVPCVGFRVQGKKSGTVEVGPIHHLDIINDQMKVVVELMEQYLSTSPHKPVQPFTKIGVWKKLFVRSSSNGDLLIVLAIKTDELSDEDVMSIKDEVIHFFTNGEGQRANLTSIYFQLIGPPKPDLGRYLSDLAWGKAYVEETLLEKNYQISGEVMFTENTAAYANLITEVSKFVEEQKADFLFDIGCGVGAMSINLADKFTKVYAIDHNARAIEDASQNAKMNNIENIEFFSKLDAEIIKTIYENIKGKKVIATISSLEYLNGQACSLLRNCKNLDHIICNWKITNYFRLFSKTRVGGKAASVRHNFLPIKATPIDIAPQTKRSQTMIVFKKYIEPRSPKPKIATRLVDRRQFVGLQTRRNWNTRRPFNNGSRNYYSSAMNNYQNEALWQRGRSEFDQGYMYGLQAMAPGSHMRSVLDREYRSYPANQRNDYQYNRNVWANDSGYQSGNQRLMNSSNGYNSSRKRGLLDPPPQFQTNVDYNHGSYGGGMGMSGGGGGGGYQDYPLWWNSGDSYNYNIGGRVSNFRRGGRGDKRRKQAGN